MTTYTPLSIPRLSAYALLIGAVILSGCVPRSSSSNNSSEQAQALQEVANIKLPTTGGQQMSIAEERGKIVMLHFIPSWCRECSAEAPSLRNLHESFKNSRLSIIGIAVDKEAFEAQSLASRLQLPFPVLMDLTGELKSFFSVKQLPSTIFLDRYGAPIYFRDPRSGKISAILEGARTWDTPEPVQMIATLVERR